MKLHERTALFELATCGLGYDYNKGVGGVYLNFKTHQAYDVFERGLIEGHLRGTRDAAKICASVAGNDKDHTREVRKGAGVCEFHIKESIKE